MTNSANTPSVLFETNLGKRRFIFTSCHRMPTRSIFYKGSPLICYRCGGINLGFLLMAFYQVFALIFGFFSVDFIFGLEGNLSYETILFRFTISLILQLPFIVDGIIQALTRYESKNPIRLSTGFLGGIGQFYFVFTLGRLTKLLLI